MIRSISHVRAREREGGFVLLSALVFAVLYFGVLGLLWFEAIERIRTAQRFRSRVEAQTLAENAAELAAENMIVLLSSKVEAENDDGRMTANYKRLSDGTFEIRGTGQTSGVPPTSAHVNVTGRIAGTDIVILRTTHRG